VFDVEVVKGRKVMDVKADHDDERGQAD